MIELGNRLLEAVLDADKENFHENNRTEQLFNELISHIKIHFSNEEAILRSIDYPEYEKHKKIHLNLGNVAEERRRQVVDHRLSPKDAVEFILGDIIIGHLLHDDFRFFPYLMMTTKDDSL